MGKAGRRTTRHSTGKNRKIKERVKPHDPDQAFKMLTPEEITRIEQRAPDFNVAGEGKNYCIICDKHFASQEVLEKHMKARLHKRRLGEVVTGGFTPKDAMAAAGIVVDNGPKRQQ